MYKLVYDCWSCHTKHLYSDRSRSSGTPNTLRSATLSKVLKVLDDAQLGKRDRSKAGRRNCLPGASLTRFRSELRM